MSGTYVSRDPFARHTTLKRFVRGASCAWCGGQNRKGKHSGSYRYLVESDGGRTSEDSKTFCSMADRRAYHG